MGSVPHVGYALADSVDTAVYQPVQLAYLETSQTTIPSPNVYLYYDQVRATQHSVSLHALQWLPRRSYELGQVYYTSPYDYPAFPSPARLSTYESANPAARDEGMLSP
jgi:hypothetical protein